MKLSKAVVPTVSVGSFVAIVAIGGVLLIQNGTRPTNTPIVDQHVAAVSTAATHSTSHAVAKPAAVVPRSTVVVKKPTVQGATVTDPTSADPTSSAPTPNPVSSDPAVIPTTSDGWGPPNKQTDPAIPPPVRSRSAGPPCIGSECPTPTG